MKKLYKLMLVSLFIFSCFVPLSVSVSADVINDYPSLTDYQLANAQQVIFNENMYPNLLIFKNYNDHLYFCYDFDFNTTTRDITYRNYYRISNKDVWSYYSDPLTKNLDTDDRWEVFYLKYNNSYYITSPKPYNPPLFNAKMNYSYHITNYDSEKFFALDSINFSFDVPAFNLDLSGDLDCVVSTSNYCEVLTFDSTNFSDASIFVPSVEFTADGSLESTTTNSLSFDINVTWEILFDDYYTGYFSGMFPNNVHASDGSIISNNTLFFTDVNKIKLEFSESVLNSVSYVYKPSLFINSVYMALSKGRPVYDSSVSGKIDATNDLLNSGNNASSSTSNSIGSVNSSLDSSSSRYEQFESQFNSNLTSSLDNIDFNSVSLVNSNDFVRTASWVKLQFDDILDSSGIYKTAISFVLIIGLALLLLGRRL